MMDTSISRRDQLAKQLKLAYQEQSRHARESALFGQRIESLSQAAKAMCKLSEFFPHNDMSETYAATLNVRLQDLLEEQENTLNLLSKANEAVYLVEKELLEQ